VATSGRLTVKRGPTFKNISEYLRKAKEKQEPCITFVSHVGTDFVWSYGRLSFDRRTDTLIHAYVSAPQWTH